MTRARSRFSAAVVLLLAPVSFALPSFAEAPAEIGGARLAPTSFTALDGWSADDHAAALAAFRRSCEALGQAREPLRPGIIPSGRLAAVCRAALAEPSLGRADARRFFETRFAPFRVDDASGGFLTGYYEPEVAGSATPTTRFPTPLLARPADLVTLKPGETRPGLDPSLSAGRFEGAAFNPYPDRAAIEEGALGPLAVPLAYVDAVDAFMAQVQGSLRVSFADGSVRRLAYAGRNGRPYRSIGKALVAELDVAPAAMTADRLVAWLRANPDEAKRVMRLNPSYVFFRIADELDAAKGPLGAASVQLVAGRSIAVDRNLWPYGLPFFVETTLPEPSGAVLPVARLVVAHDTGSAILGPARADLFLGSGAEAGLRAGLVRQPVRFTVLLPKGTPGDGR